MKKTDDISSQYFLIYCSATILMFLMGCSSTKGLYETFYVGNDGIQYFIQPLTFTGDADSDEELKIDITCKHKTVIKDSSIVNISLIGAKYFKTVDSIIINTDSCSVVLKDLNIMFSERDGDNFISRFTARSSLFGIKQIFNKSDWAFGVYAQNRSFKYITPKSTKKKIEALNYSIFMLF